MKLIFYHLMLRKEKIISRRSRGFSQIEPKLISVYL